MSFLTFPPSLPCAFCCLHYSGLQDNCLWIQGEVVTMVGRGDLLTVFYHGSNPVNESQGLHYELIDVQRRVLIASGPARISRKSLLSWAGFSDLDMLYIMDSEGVVSVLSKVENCATKLENWLSILLDDLRLLFPATGIWMALDACLRNQTIAKE